MMHEDKQLILHYLTKALRLTREYEDIISLVYDPEKEKVTAYFVGGKLGINVAMDSGSAMIRDVLRGIS